MRIVLGVTGGIAAYKAVLLLRLLREAGHRVRVVPTTAALEFVGAVTWEALSGEPVSTSVFDGAEAVEHVRIGREADLLVVAPATADLLGRAASGLADDLLTTTLLTVSCPVLLAPAMHTEMWQHPATVANVATLRSRGVHVLDPDDGRLTGADSGPGRLPEPEAIAAAALALVEPSGAADLAGVRVAISAGGTREPLDPVRFLGNRSSGRQGVALAAEAAARGADVTLVAANVDTALLPSGVDVVSVETTAELQRAMTDLAADADVLVMAAAVADYRPAAASDAKLKKSGGGRTIELVENPDVLAGLVADRRHAGTALPVIVGFAAETGDADGTVLDHARVKLSRKGCDLLVVNDVSEGRAFGQSGNEAVILAADGSSRSVPFGPKIDLAHTIWDTVVHRLDA